MSVNHGLVCQNVSAASQAITTYLRVHQARCEEQQDHPLVLSHQLSGTISDDDLLPALYSRSGGAHCTAVDNRATNFRKGTAVWYLSRATGAPCPFTRAGIRLSDYTEDGKVGAFMAAKAKKNKVAKQRRMEEQQCGQKRKRPLRGCVARASSSDSENDVEKRPPKVKLTLRLKPLPASTSRDIIDISRDSSQDESSNESSDDSMSVVSSDDESLPTQEKEQEEPWSLPPYPRRSISIPCYTPSFDGPYPFFPPPIQPNDPFRRSPSAGSIGSPPPDSEDEADDFHITMTRAGTFSDGLADADLDSDDSEADRDTQWESPGPRSPSAPLISSPNHVTVKEEPRDVQGMLEAWDDFDSSVADAKVAEVFSQAAGSVDVSIKPETFDLWDWDSNQDISTAEWPISPDDSARVKHEDFGVDPLFPEASSPPVLSHIFQSPSTLPSEFLRHDETRYATLRPRSKTVPAPSRSQVDLPLTRLTTCESSTSLPSTAHSLASLIQCMSMNSTTSVAPRQIPSPPPPCVSPHETRCIGSSSTPSVVVVHTCQPCTSAISATQIEDISVYQMMLGPFLLLRRIDTDFVNLSPIVAYSGAPHPILSAIPNATVITKGSPIVSGGTWVPLSAAQAYVRDHPLPGGLLDVFLSDLLFERFPSALQDFHRSNAQGRFLNQFGRPFGSTLQASLLSVQTDTVAPQHHQGNPQGAWDPLHGWVHRDSTVLPASGPFALGAMAVIDKHHEEKETPLSATEQQLFHELCVIPDDSTAQFDGEDARSYSPMSPLSPVPSDLPELPLVPSEDILSASPGVEHPGRPLRRSRRVADALAAQGQTRTRSRRRGSRNSLS